MKKLTLLSFLSIFLIFSCTDPDSTGKGESFDSGSESNVGNEGLITAGEWNDLENWEFWETLNQNDTFSMFQLYWEISLSNRIAISVENQGNPVAGAKLELLENGLFSRETYTDNLGRAEFFINSFTYDGELADFSIRSENGDVLSDLVLRAEGINTIEYSSSTANSKKVQLSFIVDATGSMRDEIDFLKSDLQSVINQAEEENVDYNFSTSSVFYRDQGDDYVTRTSEFTSDISKTINFIKKQSADGGGNYPEAVHEGLKECLLFDWDESAHTKIAFLILDAPPHYKEQDLIQIRSSIEIAASKGIKIIPIAASGIDKETEFLMRYFSILTNGTYVFITNDSGIGNDHITPTVGDYEVEYLNELMVRLINKYVE